MKKRNLVTLVIAIVICTLTATAQTSAPIVPTVNPSTGRDIASSKTDALRQIWESTPSSGTSTDCYMLMDRIPSNSEISRVINMSKEINLVNGIYNPDLIFPGQRLTFRFADGTIRSFTVQKGQSQWQVVKEVLKYEAINGPLVDYDYPTPIDPKKAEVGVPNILNNYIIPDWLITLFILLFGLGFFALMARTFKGNRTNARSFEHQLNVIRELRSTGGEARFIKGDMDMNVIIPKQDHLNVHISETTTIGITVNTPKEEATETKKEEPGTENSTAATDSTSTAK